MTHEGPDSDAEVVRTLIDSSAVEANKASAEEIAAAEWEILIENPLQTDPWQPFLYMQPLPQAEFNARKITKILEDRGYGTFKVQKREKGGG